MPVLENFIYDRQRVKTIFNILTIRTILISGKNV